MKEKLKVIAFGIGTSAKQYLENYRDEHDILALSDWDETTHGTTRYGFKVINPADFDKFDFDKIIILSFYVKEIIQQLNERCAIGTDMIIVPPKYKIKGEILPFQNKSTKDFAKELLVYFNNIANQSNIDLFLDFGTLLGLTRDGDIIDWDDDIDFSINEEDSEKLVNTLYKHRDQLPHTDILKWNAKVRKDKYNKAWYISLRFTNKEDLVYYPFEVAFGVRKFFGNRSVCMRNSYLSCDDVHFNKSSTIRFLDSDIKVPYNHEKYLDLLYGNWKVPQIYTFGSDYGSSFTGSTEGIRIEVEEETLF